MTCKFCQDIHLRLGELTGAIGQLTETEKLEIRHSLLERAAADILERFRAVPRSPRDHAFPGIFSTEHNNGTAADRLRWIPTETDSIQ